jgi:hypothetical protein
MVDEITSIDSMELQKSVLHRSTVNSDVTLAELGGEKRQKKEKALVCKTHLRMMPLMILFCKLVTIGSGSSVRRQ